MRSDGENGFKQEKSYDFVIGVLGSLKLCDDTFIVMMDNFRILSLKNNVFYATIVRGIKVGGSYEKRIHHLDRTCPLVDGMYTRD